MSLDGFIAYPDDSVGELFDWYNNGDVEVKPAGYPITFKISEQSAAYWRQNEAEGVRVRPSDLRLHQWLGQLAAERLAHIRGHPRAATGGLAAHPGRAVHLLVDNLESALEQARAVSGGKDIGVAGPSIAQQCLNLGVLDEIRLDLVPIPLGEGIRYFDNIENEKIQLERLQIVEARGSRTCGTR